MREIIVERKYDRGFGYNVTETYFREDEQFYCETYVTGYCLANRKIELITVDEVEKAIRAEQDKHISELAKLQENLKKLLTKQPRGAIIKTQKGSEKNEKSSEVKHTN